MIGEGLAIAPTNTFTGPLLMGRDMLWHLLLIYGLSYDDYITLFLFTVQVHPTIYYPLLANVFELGGFYVHPSLTSSTTFDDADIATNTSNIHRLYFYCNK